MEVRLLEKGYKNNEELYQDFLDDKIDPSSDYFSNKVVYIKEAPDFPIYMAKGSEEEIKNDFLKAFRSITESYLDTERDLILDETFWHSLLIQHKRDYILEKYHQVLDGISNFRNIVIKKFDWENYIYKSILGAQYINDNISNDQERERYYELIIDNLDVYNYIIKYEVFRNDKFLLNVLDIIDELDLSKLAKAKIKGREDLGDDERYGRRVIFEFNKSYPVVMAPMLEKDELKKLFITYLNYYYDVTQIISEKNLPAELLDNKNDEQSESNHEVETVLTGIVNSDDSDNNEITAVANAQTTTLVKERNKPAEEVANDRLLVYLKRYNLEYIDHRDQVGSIWVIGDRSIEEYLKPLKHYDIHFRFKPIGSKATNNRPAWFWYED